MGVIVLIADTCGAHGFEKAGPSAAAGKLGIGAEERVATDSAVIDAAGISIPVLAGEGIFGSLVAGNIVDCRRQNLLPFGRWREDLIARRWAHKIWVGLPPLVSLP